LPDADALGRFCHLLCAIAVIPIKPRRNQTEAAPSCRLGLIHPQRSGILLHVTSLPSRHGIGDLCQRHCNDASAGRLRWPASSVTATRACSPSCNRTTCSRIPGAFAVDAVTRDRALVRWVRDRSPSCRRVCSVCIKSAAVPPAVEHSRTRRAPPRQSRYESRDQSPTSIELRSHHILNAFPSTFASKSYQ
jgi:hypothetical protein